MKGVVVALGVTSATSLLALAYILFQGKKKRLGSRDIYLERLFDTLVDLPPEDWTRIQGKLDVFLDATAPICPPIESKTISIPHVVVSIPSKIIVKVDDNHEAAQVASLQLDNDSQTLPEDSQALPVPQDAAAAVDDVSRFRRMLKVGIHPQAVRNKMIAENLDPSLLFGKDEVLKVRADQAIFPVHWIPKEKLSTLSLFRNKSTSYSSITFSEKEIHSLFHPVSSSKVTSNVSATSATDENSAPPPPAHFNSSALPARRVQNIQIALVKLKRSPGEICSLLLSYSTQFSNEDLCILQSILPSPEEIKLVQKHKNSTSIVDKFVRMLSSTVVDANERVGWLQFVGFQFEERHNELENQLRLMHMRCVAVFKHASKFSTLLSIVRDVACVVNKNVQKRDDGVSIHGLGDLLVKFRSSGKVTAAEVVAHLFWASTPLGTKKSVWISEFKPNNFLSFQALEHQINTLKKDVEVCQLKSPDLDHFGLAAQEKTQQLTKAVDEVKGTFKQVLDMFGEPQEKEFPAFFNDLFAFLRVIHPERHD